MAGKKAAPKAKAAATVDREARRELDRLRKTVASLAGEVARVDADMKRNGELAKSAKGSVSKLIKDPLVSVPADLKRKVEDLEAKLIKMKVQLADRALHSSLEDLEKKVRHVEACVETNGEAIGAVSDRVDDLEAAATEPKPEAPGADPRQTTLDEAIAKAKDEQQDDGDEAPTMGNPETGEGATVTS